MDKALFWTVEGERRENRRRVQNLVGSRGGPHWSWDSWEGIRQPASS